MIAVRCLAALLLLASVRDLATVRAADFRIQTEVYQGEEKQPVSEHVTLFRGGAVYDFLLKPVEVTIFERPIASHPGRFILMDSARKVQTEISLEEVQGFTQRIAVMASGHEDAFLRFLARPQFESKFDAKTKTWTFDSANMTYRVRTRGPESQEQFAPYDEFTDWFARLNNRLTDGSRPPYGLARLAVNASLRATREIPQEVQLEITPPVGLKKKQSYRTVHITANAFSQTDMKRLDEANHFHATFRRVPLAEYLQTETAISKK